uniref:Uncharacterized protein n=1 Tax=Cacopsylla melanoneura TaxID=428564 RepID=A0A8D8TJK0_9HEMI
MFYFFIFFWHSNVQNFWREIKPLFCERCSVQTNHRAAGNMSHPAILSINLANRLSLGVPFCPRFRIDLDTRRAFFDRRDHFARPFSIENYPSRVTIFFLFSKSHELIQSCKRKTRFGLWGILNLIPRPGKHNHPDQTLRRPAFYFSLS